VSFEFWILYVMTVLIASLVPGPSMLLALSHGTKFGAKRTIATALGNTTASFLQAVVAIVGLGAILTASGTIFQIIKWLGAAYLIYIGVKTWRTPDIQLRPDTEHRHETSWSSPKMFGQAFFVAIGNPKAIIFFTALFPQFINQKGQQLPQFLVMAVTLALIAFVSFMIYAVGGHQIGALLKQANARKLFNRLISCTFIGVGLSLASSER
jgi:threonine/homoserine/homoserine lactone efflux protein